MLLFENGYSELYVYNFFWKYNLGEDVIVM